jgi:Fis1 C-terminal tetratricopeptide repeat
MEKYDDAKSDIEYLLYLEPENQDALKLKEFIDERIHYQKLVSQFPIYF